MTGSSASIDVAITVYYNGTSDVFVKTLSYSKANQGIDGADGADGSDGTNAVAVKLEITDQTFEYDTEGLNPDPASATFTATEQNTTGTIYYEFFLNDVSVQNTTSNTYSYTPPADYVNMPEKVEVQLRQDSDVGTILARDQVSTIGMKAGSDAITIALSNEAHTIPTDSSGNNGDYTGSGTTIEVYEGTNQLAYDASGTPANSTYKVSHTSTNITAGTVTDDGTVVTYGDASNMTADVAEIAFTITVTNSAGVENAFTRIQSFSKSKKGDQGVAGADGADGSDGADAVALKLSVDDQTIEYDTAGANPTPTTATITATPQNTSATLYYEFFVNDVSVQNTTSDTYTYTPQSSYANMPDKIEGQIRDGSAIGTILARDQISMVGMKAGSDAITTVLSNEAHTVPTDSDGNNGDYTGSGTTIDVYEGTNQLTYDGAASPANSTYKVTETATNITAATPTNDGTTVTYGDASNMTADIADIEFTITVTNSAGVESVFTRVQSFSKSKQGEQGIQGAAGADGSDGDNAVAVKLTIPDQTYEYNTGGTNPQPAGPITATATPQNAIGTIYYEFFLNDSSVQNSLSDTYSYAPPAAYANMPEKLEVQLRDGSTTGTILARDQISLLGMKAGSNAITTVLSNQAHTIPTDSNGDNGDYTGSGTDIEVYEGTTQLAFDETVSPANGTYDVSAAGTNITPGLQSDDGTVVTYGNASNMTADTAEIVYTITVKNSAGVSNTFTRKQSFSKSKDGEDGVAGAEGAQGPAGVNAKAVTLEVNQQTIEYETDGENPDPTQATLIATDQNTSGTIFYEFFVNDVSVQNSTDNEYIYTPQTLYENMPDTIEVQIRQDTSTGTILARDQLSMIGMKAGSDAVTVVLTNEAHTMPADEDATITDFSGSGTDIRVFEGTTPLTYGTGAGQFQVSSAVLSGTITVDSAPTTVTTDVTNDTRRYGNVESMSTNQAAVEFTVSGQRGNGTAFSFKRVQTFAKSIAGTKARSLKILPSNLSFKNPKDSSTLTPASIELNTSSSNLSGQTVTYSTTPTVDLYDAASAGSVATTSTVGTPLYLRNSDFAGNAPVTVTVTVSNSYGTFTDKATIIQLDEGTDSVQALLSNEAHTYRADQDGTVTDFTGGTTDITVYEGSQKLTYGSSANAGEWEVTTVTPSAGITLNSDSSVTFDVYTSSTTASMSADQATVSFDIAGQRQDGTSFTLQKVQSFSKSTAGKDAYTFTISPTSYSVLSDANGSTETFSFTISPNILKGDVDVTSDYTITNYDVLDTDGVTSLGASVIGSPTASGNTLTVTDTLTVDFAEIVITFEDTVNSVGPVFTGRCVVTKQKEGRKGPGVLYIGEYADLSGTRELNNNNIARDVVTEAGSY